MALDGPLAYAWADGHIKVGTLWDLYAATPTSTGSATVRR